MSLKMACFHEERSAEALDVGFLIRGSNFRCFQGWEELPVAGSLTCLLAFKHQQQERPPSIPCGPAGPGTLLGEKSSLFFNLVLHSCARVSLFTFAWLKISVKRGKEQVNVEQLPIIQHRRKGRTCTEQLPLPALC